MAENENKGKVYNHDVASLSQMLHRIGTEVHKCTSANASFINEHDFARVMSYLDWLSKKLDWIAERPLMDLPESAPTIWDVESPSQYELVENEACNDILRLVFVSLEEAQNSQSARLASGLISPDLRRIRDVIQKLYDFMNNFVESTNPIDLPESSPQRASITHGRRGV